jgi:hypothetical protein
VEEEYIVFLFIILKAGVVEERESKRGKGARVDYIWSQRKTRMKAG